MTDEPTTDAAADGAAPRRLAWLSAAQRDRCCYCGCETWLPWQRRQEARLRLLWDMPAARSLACQVAFELRMASVEHRRRRAEGGDETPRNLVMACAFCNSCRGEAEPGAHAAAMTALVREGSHPCHPPGSRATG